MLSRTAARLLSRWAFVRSWAVFWVCHQIAGRPLATLKSIAAHSSWVDDLFDPLDPLHDAVLMTV